MRAQHPECLQAISQIGHAARVVRAHTSHKRETTASQCSTAEDSASRAVPRPCGPGSDPRENCLEKISCPRVGRRSRHAPGTLHIA